MELSSYYGNKNVAFLGETNLEEVLGKILDPVTGVIKEESLEIVKPLAQEVASAVQPVVEDELKKQVPKFALISGAVFGATLLIGVALGLLTTKQRWKLK